MSASSSPRRRIIVDGSNLATEGRSMPSLAQLDDAITTFLEEYPGFTTSDITVVVDATFGHRIDPSEVADFDQAVEHGEMITPPAGAIGRGDGFILRIAEKADALVLSNDSFQEFHAERPWLFEPGRLIGGKPVPGVGWVFTPRTPVRGAKSRAVTAQSKREARQATAADGLVDDVASEAGVPTKRVSRASKAPKPAKAAKAAKTIEAARSPRGKTAVEAVEAGGDGANVGTSGSGGEPAEEPVRAKRVKKAAKAAKAAKTATKAAKSGKALKNVGAEEDEATGVTKSAKATKSAKSAKATKATKAAKETKAPKAQKAQKAAKAAKLTQAAESPEPTGAADGQARPGPQSADAGDPGPNGRRPGRSAGSPLNEPLAFLNFVAEHPVGSTFDGTVVAFTSHGAHVDIDGMLAHIPLRGLGDPPPARARSVLAKGETRPFTLVGLDAPHRRAELVLPELASLAATEGR